MDARAFNNGGSFEGFMRRCTGTGTLLPVVSGAARRGPKTIFLLVEE